MQISNKWPRPRLWIARLELLLERLIRFPIAASVIPFAFPLTVWGIVISNTENYYLFSRSVVLSLIWLAIAPYLLGLAYLTVASFFDDNRNIFTANDDAVHEIQHMVLQDLGSPRYMYISIPLTIICVLVLLNSIYLNAPFSIKLWVSIMFGILFFIAGAGFWGISRFIFIVNQICKQDLRFDPYHSDRFGGFACLSYLNIKGPVYFFSGALLFPLIFDILRTIQDNELIELAMWGVFILFIGFGLVGFLVPQFQIHNLIIRSKQKALEGSETVLQGFLNDLTSANCKDKETAEVIQLKINVYYTYFHKRISSIREWPFDASVLLQLGSSLIVPILVTGVEVFIK
jgi:hypothetical protein